MPITEPATPMSDLLSVVPESAEAGEPWTRREILQQPDTLRATQALLDVGAPGSRPSSRRCSPSPICESSWPVPEPRRSSAAASPRRSRASPGRCVEAVPTTDIVSAPDLYLDARARRPCWCRSGARAAARKASPRSSLPTPGCRRPPPDHHLQSRRRAGAARRANAPSSWSCPKRPTTVASP